MNIKNTILSTFIGGCCLLASCHVEVVVDNHSLKDALEGQFLIGTALNTPQIKGTDTAAVAIIKKQFNAITAENCMKIEVVQPLEGEFDFNKADQFVAFGEANQMFIVGHTLVWHSQAPQWFFVDDEGNDVSREVLIERMKNHIQTVMGRYKGRIQGWDVVNEAFEDDGSWRKTKFYEIIGEDYIKLAFQFAHEADPEAELYYNDYSMAHKGRRDAVVKIVENLKAEGIRIDGVGMQAHCTMTFPPLKEFEESIVAFAKTGVQVMITELDLSVLPSPFENAGAEVSNKSEYNEMMDPYKNGMPDSVSTAFYGRYLDLFKLFIKQSDKISRVTVWGVNDNQSWRNYWPIDGRTDYPLLFDRNNKAKPLVDEIIKVAESVTRE